MPLYCSGISLLTPNFSGPASREFWEAHRSLYSKEFAAFIDSDLLGSEGAPACRLICRCGGLANDSDLVSMLRSRACLASQLLCQIGAGR